MCSGVAHPPGRHGRFKIAYDYAASATTTAIGTSLATGSRLVVADARGAQGGLTGGAARAVGSPAATRWFADPAGTTLDFDGRRVAAGVLARTALSFDGAHDGVTLETSAALSITGQITLEAWVRPMATDGIRDIVAHGYTLTPEAEVYLRVNDGQYQTGSWDGDDHFAGAPIPAGDVGAWVHLAGAFDGNSWRLYRNGILLASHDDPRGALPVDQRWGVGVAGDGDGALLRRRSRRRAHLERRPQPATDQRGDGQPPGRHRSRPRRLPLRRRRPLPGPLGIGWPPRPWSARPSRPRHRRCSRS